MTLDDRVKAFVDRMADYNVTLIPATPSIFLKETIELLELKWLWAVQESRSIIEFDVDTIELMIAYLKDLETERSRV